MKIFKNISENNLRFFIVLIAFLCLLLSLIAFENNFFSKRMTTDDCLWIDKVDSLGNHFLVITQIIPGGVADSAGIKDGDLLIAINGISLSQSMKAMDILNKFSSEYITYTILRNNEIIDLKIWVYKFTNYSFLIFWIVGLGFLFVGSAVGYSKPKELTSKLFFFFSAAASIGLIMYSGTSPAGAVQIEIVSIWQKIFFFSLNILFISGAVCIPPLYVHLFLTFPVKYEFRRRKLFILFLYALVILPVLFNIIKTGTFNRFLAIYIFQVAPVLYFILGTVFFRRSLSKVTDPALKKSLSIISKGFFIGGLGISYYLIYNLINNKPVFLINPIYLTPSILVMAIPISFGYSIMKYRIFDTEFLVKKSIVFGIVTLTIVILYLILVFVLNSFFREVFEGSNQMMIITFIIIFTFSFDFVNKQAKSFVDKQFFRENYNYRKSLLEFSKELSHISDIVDLVSKIRTFLNETVGIEYFNLRVLSSKYMKALGLSQNFDLDKLLVNITKHNSGEAVIINAANISELGFTDHEKSLLLGINLIIPINHKNELIGVLTFGSKSSGKAFSEEDIDLLKSFASQSAVSLENSRLNIEQINKQKYEEEVNIAKRIQNSLLPKEESAHNRLITSGYSEPARDIGGDFYDIMNISEDKVLVAIADVSDKGIPAALYMSQVQAVLQFASKIFLSPKEMLSEINKQIYSQFNRNSFVTILLALFDLGQNKVQVARAGHTPLIRLRNNRVENIYSKGIGIGLDKDNIFNTNIEELTLDIFPNDIYMLYSDGVSESMNAQKDLYGSSRIESILLQSHNAAPDTIKSSLLSSLRSFTQNTEMHDDVTFLIIKITP
ncbi:MAG: SpoIIE family protein phosphatase [Candidatus Kapaibacterium sp.]